jgi:hypothetical protein
MTNIGELNMGIADPALLLYRAALLACSNHNFDEPMILRHRDFDAKDGLSEDRTGQSSHISISVGFW